jgi:hypothetical protein
VVAPANERRALKTCRIQQTGGAPGGAHASSLTRPSKSRGYRCTRKLSSGLAISGLLQVRTRSTMRCGADDRPGRLEIPGSPLAVPPVTRILQTVRLLMSRSPVNHGPYLGNQWRHSKSVRTKVWRVVLPKWLESVVFGPLFRGQTSASFPSTDCIGLLGWTVAHPFWSAFTSHPSNSPLLPDPPLAALRAGRPAPFLA